ncbi:MAG: response regulator [Ktedonobacteraceae bacterium]|nr:response regulator [Ktedonobacteraceae bacterium]MBO0789612.1 response regulator [Ktedonobacteraceae bacterium]
MNKHILVVDDDEEIRSLLQEALEGETFIVDTASDGLIALDKITHQQTMYEVILLDLTMPGMNGLQLIQILRQREEARLHSIIVLSGDYSALQQATSLGIRQCLIKPFDLEALLSSVYARVEHPI